MTFVALWIPAPIDAAPTALRPSAEADAANATDAAQRDLFDGRIALPNDISVGMVGISLVDALLRLTPHVIVRPAEDGSTLVWVSARGLSVRRVAAGTLAAARTLLADADRVRLGVSHVAIAAEIAARTSTRAVTGVAPRQERDFLEAHSLGTLLDTGAWPDDVRTLTLRRTVAALADLGLRSCGDLAALMPDAVAIRFGAPGMILWRLARADDPRRLFATAPRTLPSASLEWTTYELREPERLAFVARRLVERVMEEVRGSGDAARTLMLRFALAGGGAQETLVRGARPSADAPTWWRLIQAALERVTLPDGVVGLALRVEAATRVEGPQGDLFDRGFQSGAAAEAAVSRLIDDGAAMPLAFVRPGHTLPERHQTQRPLEFHEVAQVLRASVTLLPKSEPSEPTTEVPNAGRVLSFERARTRQVAARLAERAAARDAVRDARAAEGLALRILPTPRPLVVTTRSWKRARVPLCYRERLTDGARAPEGRPLVDVVTALGPDLIRVGEMIGAPVGRAYWQCFTSDMRLVLLYHDVEAPTADDTETATHGAWFLQGWWE